MAGTDHTAHDHSGRDSTEVMRTDAARTDTGRTDGATVTRGAGRDAVAAQHARFGGIKWGAAFFGWLSANGLAVILVALLSAAGVAIGLTQGVPGLKDGIPIRDIGRFVFNGDTGEILFEAGPKDVGLDPLETFWCQALA